MADPQLVSRRVDALRRIELGREDAEIEVGQQRAEKDHAVALLHELRHLLAPESPLVESDVQRMHLAHDALGEQRRGDRDPGGLGEPHHLVLEPVPVQFDAGDDHGALRRFNPRDRLLHGLSERAGIALHMRRGIGPDLVGHDTHHVAG